MLKTVAVVVGLLLVGLLATGFWSYESALFRVPVEDKVVALTYDDGPNPPYTESLLALLRQQDVKATFFLKGANVEAFPELVHAIAREGHEVGNHSYYHRPMVSFSSSDMRQEIARTNALIKAQLGYEPPLFRPPYGIQGPGVKRALQQLQMTSILMSDHGTDWEQMDPQVIADDVLEGIEPGALILLHDGHGDIDDPRAQNSREPTVVATGIIIETLKARGYRFATVGELVGMPAR